MFHKYGRGGRTIDFIQSVDGGDHMADNIRAVLLHLFHHIYKLRYAYFSTGRKRTKENVELNGNKMGFMVKNT